MANKTPTITEPIAADVSKIILDVEGGAVTQITTSLAIQTSDAKVGYTPSAASCVSTPTDHSASVQTELTNLIASVVVLHNTAEGF